MAGKIVVLNDLAELLPATSRRLPDRVFAMSSQSLAKTALGAFAVTSDLLSAHSGVSLER